jgi:tRNA-binding protein
MSVTFKEFERLDIRVAKLVTVENIPGMKKLMKAELDLGDRIAHAVLGGAEYYKPSDLEGKTTAVVANMEPRTVGGVKSECMLLAADDHGKPIWITFQENLPPGTKIR